MFKGHIGQHMAHSEEIRRELRNISGAAADLPAGLPFAVPPGYFASFPEKMLDRVRSNTLRSNIPADLKEHPTFRVPVGYFDRFSEDLMKRIHAGGEEEALPSILGGLKDLPTFQVPEGYFEGLPEYLTAQALTSGNGDVSAREEMNRLSPLLASLQGAYPGSVPSGYFEHFPQKTREALLRLSQEHLSQEQAPVVQMGNKLFPVRKFLAAAVTIGAVLLSAVWGYHIYDRPTDFIRSGVNIKTEAQFNTALAKLSDQDIMDYLGSNTDISDADLIANEVGDNPEGMQTAPGTDMNGSGQTGHEQPKQPKQPK
jgi:hypothetical protein